MDTPMFRVGEEMKQSMQKNCFRIALNHVTGFSNVAIFVPVLVALVGRVVYTKLVKINAATFWFVAIVVHFLVETYVHPAPKTASTGVNIPNVQRNAVCLASIAKKNANGGVLIRDALKNAEMFVTEIRVTNLALKN